MDEALSAVKSTQKTGGKIGRYRDVFPAMIATVCLFVIVFLKQYFWPGPRSEWEYFEFVSNGLLFAASVVGFFFFGLLKQGESEGKLARALSNLVVCVVAFIVNIDVFERKVATAGDLWAGWHPLWLGWSVVEVVFLSTLWNDLVGLGKTVLHKIGAVFHWAEDTVRANNKGIVFFLVGGMLLGIGVFCLAFWQKEASVWEALFAALIFCVMWCFAAFLAVISIAALPKTKNSIGQIQNKEFLKVVKKIVFLLAAALAVIYMFPLLPVLLGKIAFVLALIVSCIFSSHLLCFSKRAEKALTDLGIYPKDAQCILAVCLLVPLALLPAMGMMSGQPPASSLSDASSAMEFLSSYLSLISSGFDLFKTLVSVA